MNVSSQVWVVVDGDAAVGGVVEVARQVAAVTGDEVVAVVAGPRAVAEAAGESGVDRVVWLGEPGAGVPVEAYATEVARLVAEAAPRLVVAPARDAARVIVGALAARLQTPVLTAVTAVTAQDGAVVVTRAVHGGIAERTETIADGPALILVNPGTVVQGGGPAPIEEAAATPWAAVRVTEVRPAQHTGVDLGSARIVVGVGRGLKAREDLAVVEDLAAALGAEVACSRPLAEGHDWLTKDRYIGISGQHIAPDLYIAAGISGQVQHMVGVRDAKVLVAINSDADAPVFADCDFGVVGDLYQVLPALAAALRA
jgi:electron transfer flavoprotein alpha subunit